MKKRAFSLSLCLWAACLISNCAYHEVAWQKEKIGTQVKPLATTRLVSYAKRSYALWGTSSVPVAQTTAVAHALNLLAALIGVVQLGVRAAR